MQPYDKSFFDNLITYCHRYYAHLPINTQIDWKPELLSEHSALVVAYAKQIVATNHLECVIRKLIYDSIPQSLHNSELLSETLLKLFWEAIAFHDLGKLNRGFQRNRMNNYSEILHVKHTFENKHSIISVYLYLALFFSELIKMELSEKEEIFLCNTALYLSGSIYRHHSPTIGQSQNEDSWCKEDLFDLKPFLTLFKSGLNDDVIEKYHTWFLSNANHNFFFNNFNETVFSIEYGFPLYALVKLNYSLLTASDYLATAHYMNNWAKSISDFGIIDTSLRNKIINNAKTLKPYNKEVYDSIYQEEMIEVDSHKKQSNRNLNTLRKSIAVEVIRKMRENSNKNLFYLEAPTGGGKTNVSMLALAELLAKDNSIQKVFYVFPFTTLITQTYKSLKETLGLNDDELVEIHSKAALQVRNDNRDENEDSDYLNYLDNLFMNYPIALLSHIHFFDILKSNHKETNYLLHRLANSVVIIDEIQSYTPKTWDKIMYFIANYAKYFNMKFIIMSATLPKIGDIIDNKGFVSDFVYLIDDQNKYFQNPNFCNRVRLDYSLLEWDKPKKETLSDYLQQLSKTILEKSIDYAKDNTVHHDSVFTIVEFIFKKTASEFYSIVSKQNVIFDEILLLSGTILEPRRKQIINKLKTEEIRSKKILLITTQVVEAGVDIDMDLGFKDKSIIDSEEQLAGRINRNVNKPECKLYIFNCNTEKTLYGDDYRYKFMNEVPFSEYKRILQEKDFDCLYKMVIEKIKNKNKSQFIENLDDLYSAIATLDFPKVNNSLQIINQRSVSVFVPLEINISLMEEFVPVLKDFKIEYDTKVSGVDVWNCYVAIIESQKEDFVKNKILMKKLQGLMSAFTFSIFPNASDYNTLKDYGREEYGFLYLESHDNIYSFENGIDTYKLSDTNFI